MTNHLMLFEEALPLLRQGLRLAHVGHTKRGPKWIELQAETDTDLSHLVLVYSADYPGIYAGKRVPWSPARCDLLEPGWYVVGDHITHPCWALAGTAAVAQA